MKKIFLIMISMASFLLFSTNCHATEISSSITRTFIGNYHYVDQNGRFGDFELFKRSEDGQIAYCIEPGVSFTSNEYNGAYDLTMEELANKAGVTKEQLQKISLVAYFSYGYQDHNNSEWIVAAQAKIWEILGRQFQFTSRNSQANPWAYVIETPPEIQEKMNILESLVESYYKIPEINGQNLTIPLGKTYTLNDDALSGYELLGSYDGVNKNGNTLSITPNKIGSFTVNLKQNLNIYSTPFVVYYHSSSQNLLLTGNVPEQEIYFSYQVTAGSLDITKYDIETKKCQNKEGKPIGKAVYGLYQKDGTLKTTITVTNCMGSATNIPLGEYYLQEIEAPEGYLLDPQKYGVTITEENITIPQKIQVYEEEDTKKIIIYKEYLKENETLTPEENVKFEIVNKNTNQVVATLTTDAKGVASTTLSYGTYIIRQISGTPGYEFIEPKEFIVDKNSQNEFTYSFVNKPFLKNIKVLKKDDSLKNQILQSGIKFKLYDITNQKYICRNEECTFETNEYGELIIKDLYYSTYRLEEINQELPGYLWNQEGLEFMINEDSEEEITLEFYNQPVLGEIMITKTDETNTPLQDITFQVFAKVDIYQNGVLLYTKGELVAQMTTNKDGLAILSGLPLGTYTVVELQTQDGYILDTNSYDISLEYQDNKTSIIYKELSLINYKVPETKKNHSFIPFHTLLLGLGYFLYEKKYIHM